MNQGNKIKINLNYADEQGVFSNKEFTINCGTPIITDRSKFSFYKKPLKYTLTFSMKLPDHYVEKLRGATVSRSEMGRRNATFTYPKDFESKIKSQSLLHLTDRYQEIFQDYLWLFNREEEKITKVIFYKLSGYTADWNSNYNGTGLGSFAEIGFNFAVGYLSADETIRYNQDKNIIEKSNHRVFYNLKFVVWSQERENFFINFASCRLLYSFAQNIWVPVIYTSGMIVGALSVFLLVKSLDYEIKINKIEEKKNA